MPITYNETGVTYDATGYTYNGDPFAPSVFPVAGVYVAFDDGPYTASPAWTEITTYVRSITVRRGRADDFEQFDTGTAQLVLDNRERRFDPFYTSGPYYLKLTPRRQIRIVGQIGGSTYEVFRGYVAGWPVEWSEAGYDSTVTIQAFDALGLMANETLPTDWPDFYTRAQNPTVYFKCNDSQGTQILVDAISNGAKWLKNRNPATNPNFFEAPAIVPGAPSSSIFAANYINAQPLNSATAPAGAIVGDYPILSLSAWCKGTGPQSGSYNAIQVENNGGKLSLYYSAGTVWISQSRFGLSTSGNRIVDTAYVPSFGQPFHIFIIANNSTTPTVYINGALVTTSAASGTGSGGGWPLTLELGFANVQEVAVWDQRVNFTAADVAAIYNAGAARFSETTTARMNRLIGTTDYPSALQGFTTSPAASVAEIGTGTGVIPEMQLVADSEGGEIYVSKTGVLTTTNRTDVFNATRSANVQATITDSGVGIRYGTDVSIEYDGDNLKNDVTVTFSGDGEVNAYSDAVISAYGGSSTTIETQLADPTSAAQLALVELGVEGSLVPRISPIDVSPNTAAADWQTILGLELLDRVTFKRTPSVGNQFSRDALINAIDHQIEPGVWRTQLTLSMRYTSPLTCDDDVLGTVDFNYCG